MTSVRTRRLGRILVLLVLWLTPTAVAHAASSTSDGLLAVQPVHGSGVLLVPASGHGARRVCAPGGCRLTAPPAFSPDGRSLLLAVPQLRTVTLDGDCLNCTFGAAPAPAFLPDGTEISFLEDGGLAIDGIDGLRDPLPAQLAPQLTSGLTDAVWSPTGELAVVRDGSIWVGTSAHLIRLARGSSPSWSPNGTRLAYANRGSIWTIPAAGGGSRRLVTGRAPTYSPSGADIAYVGVGDRIETVPAGGGSSRPVGDVRGLSVAWQPEPHPPAPECVPPAGSQVITGPLGTVSARDGSEEAYDSTNAVMACLYSDGEERLLEKFNGNTEDVATFGGGIAIGGEYALVGNFGEDFHYGGSGEDAVLFDIATAQPVTIDDPPGANCLSPPGLSSAPPCGITSAAVLTDGDYAAVLDTQATCPGSTGVCDTETLDLYSRADAPQPLDSAAPTTSSTPTITDVQASGQTITWDNDGAPRSYTAPSG